MLLTPPSISPAPSGDGDPVPGGGLAGRVLSGPGLWLDRASLLEELLAGGVIARALEDESILDPYDGYRTLRDSGPAVLLDRYDVYAVARYRDVCDALHDNETLPYMLAVSIGLPVRLALSYLLVKMLCGTSAFMLPRDRVHGAVSASIPEGSCWC